MVECVLAAQSLLRIMLTSCFSVYTATLASSIVLMMDLFHAIDTDLSEDAIKDVRGFRSHPSSLADAWLS